MTRKLSTLLFFAVIPIILGIALYDLPDLLMTTVYAHMIKFAISIIILFLIMRFIGRELEIKIPEVSNQLWGKKKPRKEIKEESNSEVKRKYFIMMILTTTLYAFNFLMFFEGMSHTKIWGVILDYTRFIFG